MYLIHIYPHLASWVKSVRISSYSDPHFPIFGLNNSEHGHFLYSEVVFILRLLKSIFHQCTIHEIMLATASSDTFQQSLESGSYWLGLCSSSHKYPTRSLKYPKDSKAKILLDLPYIYYSSIQGLHVVTNIHFHVFQTFHLN